SARPDAPERLGRQRLHLGVRIGQRRDEGVQSRQGALAEIADHGGRLDASLGVGALELLHPGAQLLVPELWFLVLPSPGHRPDGDSDRYQKTYPTHVTNAHEMYSLKGGRQCEPLTAPGHATVVYGILQLPAKRAMLQQREQLIQVSPRRSAG